MALLPSPRMPGSSQELYTEINSPFSLGGWAWQRSFWEGPDLPRSWQEFLPLAKFVYLAVKAWFEAFRLP